MADVQTQVAPIGRWTQFEGARNQLDPVGRLDYFVEQVAVPATGAGDNQSVQISGTLDPRFVWFMAGVNANLVDNATATVNWASNWLLYFGPKDTVVSLTLTRDASQIAATSQQWTFSLDHKMPPFLWVPRVDGLDWYIQGRNSANQAEVLLSASIAWIAWERVAAQKVLINTPYLMR